MNQNPNTGINSDKSVKIVGYAVATLLVIAIIRIILAACGLI